MQLHTPLYTYTHTCALVHLYTPSCSAAMVASGREFDGYSQVPYPHSYTVIDLNTCILIHIYLYIRTYALVHTSVCTRQPPALLRWWLLGVSSMAIPRCPIHTLIHTRAHLYTHLYSYTHTYTPVNTLVHLHSGVYLYTHLYTHAHTCTPVNTFVHLHSGVFLYTHLYTHAHTRGSAAIVASG